MDSNLSVTFWGLVIGTTVGIVAGSFVQYIAQQLYANFLNKSLLKTFKKELEYDVGVLDDLLHEAASLRTAIGSNTLANYFGNFKLTDVFFVLSNKALSEGLLYHAIEQIDLLNLQKAATFCSAASENWISNEIQQLKQGHGTASPAVFIDYLEGELRRHKIAIVRIITALNTKKV